MQVANSGSVRTNDACRAWKRHVRLIWPPRWQMGGFRTMQWTNCRPFVPTALFDRVRLRGAALRYAAHGWAVTPGACLGGARFACDRAGCPIMGCHPAIESWEDTASADPARVTAWWRRRPHTVLLATGRSF